MLINAIESYLAVRRAVGFQLRVTECLLRSYARFAAERGESHVHCETAIAWASMAPTQKQCSRRLKALIRFARYTRAEDSLHEIPPDGIFGHHRQRPIPYIYSLEEIYQIISEAGRLGPAGSLRPMTYRTLFGLIAACGLRVSETLAIRLEDVTADGLVIRQSKFRKCRLVPLHKTTEAELQRYLDHRRRLGGGDDHVFISLRGTVLCYPTVITTFLFLIRKLGIRPGPGKPGPCIQHLRHAFAVRALQACPDGRESVRRHMLALSTYLGHSHVADTYWYLESTPQLMTDIANACEDFFKGGQQS